MAEYIEIEAVVDLIQQYANGNVKVEEVFLLTDLLGDITNISAADVQPVKRGHWELMGGQEKWLQGYTCSECGGVAVTYECNFCPNCGADMRGEDNE